MKREKKTTKTFHSIFFTLFRTNQAENSVSSATVL